MSFNRDIAICDTFRLVSSINGPSRGTIQLASATIGRLTVKKNVPVGTTFWDKTSH
jgi:hypothetical protein